MQTQKSLEVFVDTIVNSVTISEMFVKFKPVYILVWNYFESNIKWDFKNSINEMAIKLLWQVGKLPHNNKNKK